MFHGKMIRYRSISELSDVELRLQKSELRSLTLEAVRQLAGLFEELSDYGVLICRIRNFGLSYSVKYLSELLELTTGYPVSLCEIEKKSNFIHVAWDLFGFDVIQHVVELEGL